MKNVYVDCHLRMSFLYAFSTGCFRNSICRIESHSSAHEHLIWCQSVLNQPVLTAKFHFVFVFVFIIWSFWCAEIVHLTGTIIYAWASQDLLFQQVFIHSCIYLLICNCIRCWTKVTLPFLRQCTVVLIKFCTVERVFASIKQTCEV